MRNRWMDSWRNGLSFSGRRTTRQSRCRWDQDRVRLEDLDVTGSKVVKKSNKITRLFYENFNGLNHTWKVRRLNSLRNTMHLDLVCGTEPNRKRTASNARPLAEDIFRNTPYVQTVSSFNHHENFGPRQRGGAFMATGGDLATRVARTGGDFTSLGRWSWVLVGSGDRLTRIITAYQPCRSRKDGYSTSYNQQRRFWRSKGIRSCPKKLFRDQLIATL